jgi:phosphatidate cytidylyltransferase
VIRRIVTGVVFTLAVALLLLPGFHWPLLSMLFFAAVSVVCVLELTAALEAKGLKPSRPVAVIGSFGVLMPLIPLIFRAAPEWRLVAAGGVDPASIPDWAPLMTMLLSQGLAVTAFLMLILAMVLILSTVLAHGPGSLIDGVATTAMVGYVAFPLSCSVLVLYAVPDGFLWMLAAPIASWVTDVFAYFAGSLFGRNKLVPNISPKKTIEGALGGVLGCMGIMALFFWLFVGKGWPVEVSARANLLFGLALGLVCGATAQFGDWLASAVKRYCGVKDFGNVLPGHGGVLDRFDSVLFTAPLMLLASLVYYLARPFAGLG